jgi:nucleotidyltransferase substrate binding protein (TIGR01987 family)
VPNSPKDVFRVAADLQIIPDPQPYFEYLKKRNLSSHTYSESQADAIYEAVIDFPAAVEAVLTKISAD